ncbi:MAG: hypothetical protein QM541_14615, partial [Flavobacterium sp.]|nr:hypothetical protein [Flavobacterium sp.]
IFLDCRFMLTGSQIGDAQHKYMRTHKYLQKKFSYFIFNTSQFAFQYIRLFPTLLPVLTNHLE